jgi:hypothetical protein
MGVCNIHQTIRVSMQIDSKGLMNSMRISAGELLMMRRVRAMRKLGIRRVVGRMLGGEVWWLVGVALGSMFLGENWEDEVWFVEMEDSCGCEWLCIFSIVELDGSEDVLELSYERDKGIRMVKERHSGWCLSVGRQKHCLNLNNEDERSKRTRHCALLHTRHPHSLTESPTELFRSSTPFTSSTTHQLCSHLCTSSPRTILSLNRLELCTVLCTPSTISTLVSSTFTSVIRSRDD